jgi:hypothetical protein
LRWRDFFVSWRHDSIFELLQNNLLIINEFNIELNLIKIQISNKKFTNAHTNPVSLMVLNNQQVIEYPESPLFKGIRESVLLIFSF